LKSLEGPWYICILIVIEMHEISVDLNQSIEITLPKKVVARIEFF
jgi:hypothetical protein